jgi:glucose/arabinose dehydrogenase
VLVLNIAGAGLRRAAGPRAGESRFCDTGADVAGVTVPAGFCIRKFADVQTPRVMLFAPNGDLFVSSPLRQTPGGAPPGAGAIFLFRGADPAAMSTFAAGDHFESVHGMLISSGRFFYTVETAVYSVPYSSSDTQIASAPRNLEADLSLSITGFYARWTHSLAQAPGGGIYVASGQLDNGRCPVEDERAGSVIEIGGDSRGRVISAGYRDPLFLRCMPWGTCYTVELSGDAWEDKGGFEKLMEIHTGDRVGYPCCIDRNLPNPDLPVKPDCSRVVEAKHSIPLHDTPFGFDWERSGQWPAQYRGAFFVGLHGSFALWTKAGLRWAPVDPATHIPLKAPVDFATGFGRRAPISRVADVQFAPDGRLFFTDDQGGAIYWIAPRTLAPPKR